MITTLTRIEDLLELRASHICNEASTRCLTSYQVRHMSFADLYHLLNEATMGYQSPDFVDLILCPLGEDEDRQDAGWNWYRVVNHIRKYVAAIIEEGLERDPLPDHHAPTMAQVQAVGGWHHVRVA